MSSDRARLALLVHEVRSPVAALAAVARALADGAGRPGDERRLLDLAVVACTGIERLVRDAASASVVLERIDLARVVREVADAATLTGPTPVRVHGADSEIVVRADPLRVRQALDNLLRNAAAASPAGAEVVIEVALGPGTAQIAVTDDGPGIAADDLARIFEAGVRLDESQPGSGLGLALARSIAEAHAGHVRVESTVGAGSTFTLELPVTPPADDDPTGARGSPGGSR